MTVPLQLSDEIVHRLEENASMRGMSLEDYLQQCATMKNGPPAEPRETAVQSWHYLVRRRHTWRKQLYIKGRNLTARQLVGAMRANQLDEEKASANYHLAIDAIREAVRYVDQNGDLLATEAQIERLMVQRGGAARGPQPVS